MGQDPPNCARIRVLGLGPGSQLLHWTLGPRLPHTDAASTIKADVARSQRVAFFLLLRLSDGVDPRAMPKDVWDEAARTRTALGDAAKWYNMYNNAGAEAAISASTDNRAQAGGTASWGDPFEREKIRLGMKHSQGQKTELFSNTRGGLSSAAWLEPKAARPFARELGSSPNLGTSGRAFAKLKLETAVQDRLDELGVQPYGEFGPVPRHSPEAQALARQIKANGNWTKAAVGTVTDGMALTALLDAGSSAGSLPRMRSKEVKVGLGLSPASTPPVTPATITSQRPASRLSPP